MKCPNCSSQMFVSDETLTQKSHVTFFRCSLCVSEHVSSEPIAVSLGQALDESAKALMERPAAGVQYAV